MRLFGKTVEPIKDQGELAQIRRQARGVMIKSFGVAAGLTVLILLLPR